MIDAREAGFSPERLARIRPAMERHIGADKLAGVVTLLARGGHVVHHEAIGGLERDGGEPMSRDAIFRLYSMTKPLTCVALMTLYEQGHFQLPDPVSKFIPEFDHLKVRGRRRPGGGACRPGRAGDDPSSADPHLRSHLRLLGVRSGGGHATGRHG